MREKLGVLLVESESGEVHVQLFEGVDQPAAAFERCVKSAEKVRMTFLGLKYNGDKLEVTQSETKWLPAPREVPSESRFLVE